MQLQSRGKHTILVRQCWSYELDQAVDVNEEVLKADIALPVFSPFFMFFMASCTI